MPYIDVDGKTFYIGEEESAFLRIYKGSENDEDFKLLFGDNASSFFLSSSLGYRNLNMFLNFLNNPNDELLKHVMFSDVSKMIDMTANLINIASNYAYVCGPIGNVLYRSEDARNILGYESGELSSMKSTTSKEEVTTFTFNYDNTEKVAYKVYGFCPYILVDKCVDGKFFGSEAEYLFPPFIKCKVKDEEHISSKGTKFSKVIEIYDDFSEELDLDSSLSDEELASLIEKFKKLISIDKKNGHVSEETRSLAIIINRDLKLYARYKYKMGRMYYDMDSKVGNIGYDVVNGSDTLMNACLSWDEQYRGFEDALIQYYQEPDRNWRNPDTIHVYTLSYMIDSGLFDKELLDKLYGSSDSSQLDSFFLDGGYRMSDENYFEFLNSFNIMAGYGEHGKDELFEVKNEMSGNAITVLYNNKSYGDSK